MPRKPQIDSWPHGPLRFFVLFCCECQFIESSSARRVFSKRLLLISIRFLIFQNGSFCFMRNKIMLEIDYFLMNRLVPSLNSMLPVICGDFAVNSMIQIDTGGYVDFRHEKYGAAPRFSIVKTSGRRRSVAGFAHVLHQWGATHHRFPVQSVRSGAGALAPAPISRIELGLAAQECRASLAQGGLKIALSST